MRLIFDEDVENIDFLEIILSRQELDKMQSNGIVGKFKDGFNDRALHVHIREESVDYVYEDEEE